MKSKKIIVLTILASMLSVNAAWADHTTSIVAANNRLSNGETQQAWEKLKTETVLTDGTNRIMDYINGLVFEFPKGSGFIFNRAQSYVATVLEKGELKSQIKRVVFPEAEAQHDESDDAFLQEVVTPSALVIAGAPLQSDDDSLLAKDNVKNSFKEVETPENLSNGFYLDNGMFVRSLMRWQDESGYHLKGTILSEDDSEYFLQMDSAEVIADEAVSDLLEHMRLMSVVERSAYLDLAAIADVKKITVKDKSTKQLIDYANGYTFDYPMDMTVDFSMGDLRTVLENSECRVEIYRQPLNNVSAASYKNYSNSFLKNDVDHFNIKKHKDTFGGMNAQITQWERPKLSQIANDRNYYYSVDLVRSQTMAYTIFYKSTKDISHDDKYQQILESFTLMSPIGTVTKGSFRENKKDAQPAHYTKWNEETQKLYDDYFVNNNELTWGIFEPNAPLDFYTLNILEKKLDYQFEFLLHYQHLPTDNALADQISVLNNAYKQGRIVELTLQTTDMGEDAGNTVYDILNGKHDGFLTQYAKNIAAFGHPVLFRLCNEMNGDWCQYSAFHTSKDTELYKAMYNHIYDIFEQEGANVNTLWVWNPNEKSFPDFSWNNAMMYYPGNERVDIVGMTGYNTGNYYAGEKWRTFDEIYRPLYQEYQARFDKPMMITEFASASFGGDKELWVRQMFQGIKGMKQVKVAIWWSGCDWASPGVPARIYYLDETPELIELFKELLHDETLK